MRPRRRLALTVLLAAVALPAPARAAAPVVSLTFDDAIDVAAPALAVLPPLRATFYLNSDTVGVSGGLSLGAVQQLAAAGNEIGGHTANHLDLARIEDPVELRREACWDRKQLSILPRADGSGATLDIMSFAYPNGDYAWPDASADTRITDLISGAAAPGPAFGGCAYSSARAVGGVLPSKPCQSASVDAGCVLKGLPALPFADPASRYRIPTPASVDAGNGSARFATLRNWVAAAQRAGTAAGAGSSPWLVLVLHHVCAAPLDPAAACPERYGIRTDDLAALAAFLKAEQAAGRLAVRTVTGALDAAYGTVTRERPLGLDAVPAPAAQARVVNGTMDLDSPPPADGRPDCFDVSDEQAPVTHVQLHQADGSVGWVARLDVPRGESQRFTVRHDLGGCAVGVTAGKRYRLSVSYRVVSAGTDVAPAPGTVAPAASPVALFAWARNATAVVGAGAHHYGGRWFLAPQAAPWPVRAGWRTATCVTQLSPAARDALAPGLSVVNTDDAPGVAGLRDPVTGTLSILVDDVALTPSTAAATCVS